VRVKAPEAANLQNPEDVFPRYKKGAQVYNPLCAAVAILAAILGAINDQRN